MKTPEDDPTAPDTSIDLPQNIGNRDTESALSDPRTEPDEGPCCSLKNKKIRGLITVIGFITSIGMYFIDNRSCPKKWKPSGEKCFFISQERNTWNHSLEFCRSGGGTLLTTINNKTLGAIKKITYLRGDHWVGLRKGTDWNGSDHINSTGPNNSQLNCAVIDSKWKIVFLVCSSDRPWICVKPLRRPQ